LSTLRANNFFIYKNKQLQFFWRALPATDALFWCDKVLSAQLLCIAIRSIGTWTGDRCIVYGCSMLDTKFIDDLARQISNGIPSGVKGLQQDIEKNIHTLLQGAFSRLDLVTREEFDAQSQVLLRTREKLQQLEQLVAEMEAGKNRRS
jgi:hypothetical protein